MRISIYYNEVNFILAISTDYFKYAAAISKKEY